MMAENVRLREATMDDMDLVFEWANDPEGRKNSFHTEPIPYDTHCNWYKNKMDSKDSNIYIYCEENRPAGQIRVDMEGQKAVISYFIEKNSRNRGHGKRIIQLLKEKVIHEYPQITELVAEVKKENYPSQKIFEDLGFTKHMERELISYSLLLRE